MDLLYICPKCGYDLQKRVDTYEVREVCLICGYEEHHPRRK